MTQILADAISTVLGRIRPQVFLAMILLGALSGFLIFMGAVEGAVGLAGTLGLLAKEIIQADESSGKRIWFCLNRKCDTGMANRATNGPSRLLSIMSRFRPAMWTR